MRPRGSVICTGRSGARWGSAPVPSPARIKYCSRAATTTARSELTTHVFPRSRPLSFPFFLFFSPERARRKTTPNKKCRLFPSLDLWLRIVRGLGPRTLSGVLIHSFDRCECSKFGLFHREAESAAPPPLTRCASLSFPPSDRFTHFAPRARVQTEHYGGSRGAEAAHVAHRDVVRCLALSEDGRLVATGGDDAPVLTLYPIP